MLRPLLAVCFLFILLAAAPAGATTLTARMSTPHFVVHYDPPHKFLASSTADTAEDELARISKALGYDLQPGDRFPLWVYPTHLSFIDEVGLDNDFTVGVARSGDERICVDASGAFVTVRRVLAHEITHAVVFRILGDKAGELPLWANEGLAKYESEDYPDADNELLADAAALDRLIPLSSLKTTFPKNSTDLAYAESASAMRYLIKRRGPDAPRVLLGELARRASFDKAFARAAGQSQDEFVAGLNRSLSKKFAVYKIYRTLGALGSGVMAILVIVAFVIRRRRMAQAARQWDWEEFEESMGRQLREWPHR